MWGGGALRETVLWNNSNPTSAMGDSVSLSLSDDLNNYKYIKVTFRTSRTNSTESSVIMSIDDFKATAGSAEGSFRLTICAYTTALFVRIIRYNSDTSVVVSRAISFTSSTENNNATIPTKISGLK